MKRGVSVLEVIIASAIFVIFASPAVIVMIQGFNLNRLAAEQAIANQFASEGIEAVRSIKNQAYSNLVNSAGTGVIRNGSNVWAFSGANNTFNSGKVYTRTITIADVNRDGSGNIVTAPSGTLDSLTKKVTSDVTWNFNTARPESVNLITYLSNWRKVYGSGRGGMLVYGDGGTSSDAIKYKIFDGSAGTWTAATAGPDVDTGTTTKALRAARLFSSSTRDEKILISRHYITSSTQQYIYASVYNGSSWISPSTQLSTWTASTFLDVRNFDGTYLANGDFMVVYSDNTSTPKFQVWNGSTWTSGSLVNLATNGSGIPNYITVRARPGTNEVMTVFYGQAKDTNTEYFNGGSYTTANWTLHARHANNAPLNTEEFSDFTWSPNSSAVGALIFSSASNDRAMDVKVFNANGSGSGTWTGSANTSNQGTLGAMEIAGRVGATEFLACDKDANNDIYCFRSNSTPTWTAPTNNILTTTTDTGIQRSFDMDFESISGATALAVYSDNTSTPKFKKYTASTNTIDSAATNITALGGILKTVRIRAIPDSDDMLVIMADANNDVYSIIWDGSANAMYTTPAGKALTTHGTNGSATTDYWYDFAWDKQ